MPAKCTKLTPSQRADHFSEFRAICLDGDDVENLHDLFDNPIFYKRISRREILYHCSRCGNEWSEAWRKGPLNGVEYCCPACMTAGPLRPVGIYRRSGADGYCGTLSERHNAVFVRTASDGGLLVTAGAAYIQYYIEHGDVWPGWGDAEDPIYWPEPEIIYDETHRYYMAPGVLLHWRRSGSYIREFGECRYCDASGWDNCQSAGEPFPAGSISFPTCDGGEYTVFGWGVLSESSLRYSQVEDFFNFPQEITRGRWRNVVSYLAWYAIRPQIEMLHKLGFDALIEELLDKGSCACRPNWRAKNPAAFFRLSKAEVKLLLEADHGADALAFWREVQSEMSFAEYLGTGCVRYLSRRRLQEVRDLCQELGLPMLRTLRRLGDTAEVQLWVDYIRMARQLNLDLSEETVRLPKNLRERHDTCMEQVEFQANTEALKQYRRRLKGLRRRYELEAGGWCIRVPTCASEIRAEGKALRHCVGSYAERHLQGKTVILFLRSVEDPDTPLCTIEMMGARWAEIRQIHGYQNDRNGPRPREAYKDLLDVWLPWLEAGSPRDGAGRPIVEATAQETEAAAV